MFRKISTALLAIMMLFGSIVFSNSIVNAADQGWEYTNDKWCYYQDGTQVMEGWITDSEGWHYIKDGSLFNEGWVQDFQGWCYIQNGLLVQNGWVKDDKGWSYIKNGYLMQEGWIIDSEGWHYIKDGCLMQEGWAKDAEGWRYIKDGYLMQEGWAKDAHGWRYIKDGYLVQEGWAKDSKGWSYIQNGYMAKASMWAVDSKGWSHIDSNGYWDGQTTVAVPSNTTPVTPPAVITGNIKISFINVGQAESILIQQGNSTMLIDAGNDIDGPMVKDYISGQGINHLDYVIGTHPHEDHIGGLGHIIENFKIGQIYMPKVTTNTQIFEDFMAVIKKKDMKVITPVPGSTFKLGEAVCTILGPLDSDPNDLNTYSMVMKITFGNNSFLFTSDAAKSNEQAMIKAGYDLSADVLKVGHHGVFTSTSQAFLEEVNPKYAVISVGKGNLNGPPAPEVLSRLYNNKINTFRTDYNGTIICTSNGKDINFSISPVKLEEFVKENDVQITDIDLEKNIVKIKNNSKKDQDMTGWKLVKAEENQIYSFPENYVLTPETEITIASDNSEGDLKWTDKVIWNGKGKAKLYDNNGELISNKINISK